MAIFLSFWITGMQLYWIERAQIVQEKCSQHAQILTVLLQYILPSLPDTLQYPTWVLRSTPNNYRFFNVSSSNITDKQEP